MKEKIFYVIFWVAFMGGFMSLIAWTLNRIECNTRNHNAIKDTKTAQVDGSRASSEAWIS